MGQPRERWAGSRAAKLKTMRPVRTYAQLYGCAEGVAPGPSWGKAQPRVLPATSVRQLGDDDLDALRLRALLRGLRATAAACRAEQVRRGVLS